MARTNVVSLLQCCVVVVLLVLVWYSEGVTARRRRNVSREHRLKKIQLIRKYMRMNGAEKGEGILRLVGGSGEHEGNVEIFHLGKWGSICDDEWDIQEGSIVCNQIGFPKVEKVTHSSWFGKNKRKYWMDNLYCAGTEKTLSDCRFDGWGNHDCTDGEAAGVVCQLLETTPPPTTPPPPPQDEPKMRIKDATPHKVQMRLTGGRFPEEGRVEVKIGDMGWGVLCGDGWDKFEGMVVCRELGYGYAQEALQTNFFEGKELPMILSGVQCHGNEESITDCLHYEIGKVNCPGRKYENIAAVVCSSVLADLVPDHNEVMRSAHLEDRQLYFLQCAMEENCASSSAYKLVEEQPYDYHLESRRLLRFTASIANVGDADFMPFVPKQHWQWHQCHLHYHSMEVFAHFDILDSKGNRMAEGHKASFCLEDNACLPGVEKKYACANYGDQGISAGCSDIYRHNIDCQWVDITDLEPGNYIFKMAINSEFKVAEKTFDNNAAVCNLVYTMYYAQIYNCTLQRP